MPRIAATTGTLRVAQAQHQVLQLLLLGRDALGAALHEHRHQRLEVRRRPRTRRRATRSPGPCSCSRRSRTAFSSPSVTVGLIRCSFAVMLAITHLAVERPDAHLVVLEELGAGLAAAGTAPDPSDALAEVLALVHRQRAARDVAVLRCAPRAFGRVHAVAAIEHPGRQRRFAQRLAGVDVVLSPTRPPASSRLPATARTGPASVPKPQRIAKSTSRALSAMSARCTAT